MFVIAGSVPLALDPGTQDTFNIAKLSVIFVGALALIAISVIELILLRQPPPWRNGLHWPVIALTGWLAVATAASADPRSGMLGLYRQYDGLLSAIAFVVIFFAAAQSLVGGAARTALSALYFAAGGAAAAYGALQLHDRCFAGARWDPLALGNTGFGQSAIWSTLGNPNHFSGLLAILIPVGIGLGVLERRRWIRAVIGLLTALMLLELLHTQTRGALLGLAIGCGVLAVMLWPDLRARPRPALAIGGLLLIAVAGLPLLFGSPACPAVQIDLPGRLAAAADIEGRTSTAVRLELWRAALAIARDDPITGLGLSGFRWHFGAYKSDRAAELYGQDELTAGPHDVFLNYLVSGGIPALIAFVVLNALAAVLVVRTWRRLRRAERVGRSNAPWRLRVTLGAAAAGTAAYLAQATFNVQPLALSFCFWLLLGAIAGVASDGRAVALAAAAQASKREPRLRDSKRRNLRAGSVRTSATVALLIVLGIAAIAATAPQRADRSFLEARQLQSKSAGGGSGRPQAIASARARYVQAIAQNPWEATYLTSYADFVLGLPGPAGAEREAAIATFREARALLEQAVALQPRDHIALSALAEVLLRLHVLEGSPELRLAALKALRHAIDLDPRRAAPSLLLAQALSADPAAAATVLERALAQLPRNLELLRATARSRDASGERARAAELWRQILLIAPGDADAERALAGR